MSTCVRCNTSNVEDALYCDECGAPVGERAAAAAVAEIETPAPLPHDAQPVAPVAPNGGRTMPFKIVAAQTVIEPRASDDDADAPAIEAAEADFDRLDAERARVVELRSAPKQQTPNGEHAAPAATRTPADGRHADGSPAAHAKLVIERGRSAGKGFLINDAEAQIGRWDADGGIFPDVDLDADDPEAKVSRRHARILRRADGYFIEDLGSTNGTFINRGRRLMPGALQPLRDGDEIIVGKTFLRLHIIN